MEHRFNQSRNRSTKSWRNVWNAKASIRYYDTMVLCGWIFLLLDVIGASAIDNKSIDQETTTAQQVCQSEDTGGSTVSTVRGYCNNENGGETTIFTGDNEDDPTTTRCTLYIAPSTIPNAGLGTYTATSRKIGDSLGEGDLCIPYIDLNGHLSLEYIQDPFIDHVWQGFSMGMFRDNPRGGTMAGLCLGLGAAVNSHAALINARKAIPEYDPFLQWQLHPGAGAISPYHDATSTALRNIPAG